MIEKELIEKELIENGMFYMTYLARGMSKGTSKDQNYLGGGKGRSKDEVFKELFKQNGMFYMIYFMFYRLYI